jgi:hypothetical protein
MVPFFFKSRHRLIRLELDLDILAKLQTTKSTRRNACSNPSEGGHVLGAFEVG